MDRCASGLTLLLRLVVNDSRFGWEQFLSCFLWLVVNDSK